MKIKTFLTILLLLLWMQVFFAQSQAVHTEGLIKLPNADACGAIEITDSIFGPVNVSLGFGAIKELSETSKGANDMEQNSAWFKFTMPYDTILTFDIVPIDSLDDYDFVLFKCSDGDCAGKDPMKNLIKVRRCFSLCPSKSGMTGLSTYANVADIGTGDWPAYVGALPARAGETYYLIVNLGDQYFWQYGSQDVKPKAKKKTPLGFYIYFYNYYPKRKPIVLNTIFFETNKSTLKSESFKELDKLVLRLMKNPMVIEIRGHTDNVGDETKNLLLSQERAKAVKDYLVSKNIKESRIYCKGFGGTKPIADNKTEQDRKKNRRVEFVVLLN